MLPKTAAYLSVSSLQHNGYPPEPKLLLVPNVEVVVETVDTIEYEFPP